MFTTSRWSAKLPSPFGSAAQSSAGVTRLVEPSQPNTRSAYRSAWGATPGPMLKAGVVVPYAPGVYGPAYVAPAVVTPRPAEVPATCEPCPLQSSGFLSGVGRYSAGSSDSGS